MINFKAILLLFLVSCIFYGCNNSSVGYTHSSPKIYSGEDDITLSFGLSIIGSSFKSTDVYFKDIKLIYKIDNLENTYEASLIKIESTDKKIVLECKIPKEKIRGTEKVEYVFLFSFDGKNKTRKYTVLNGNE